MDWRLVFVQIDLELRHLQGVPLLLLLLIKFIVRIEP
jgi:hypothetical protein